MLDIIADSFKNSKGQVTCQSGTSSVFVSLSSLFPSQHCLQPRGYIRPQSKKKRKYESELKGLYHLVIRNDQMKMKRKTA